MKILLFEWNGIMQRDIKACLRRNGIEVKTMGYEFYSKQKNEPYFQENLRKYLKDDCYDAVMSVHLFAPIADVCHEMGVPYLAWIYDSPFFIPRMDVLKYPEVYAFVFDRILMKELQKQDYRVWHVPLAVDTSRLDQIELTREDLSRYKTDVSFVGQLYSKADPEQDPMRYHTYCSRVEKISLLSKSCHLKLYCSDEEKKIIPIADAMGTVQYYTEMPKVFKCSKVNLNISLECIESGIPLRILDILGAGGFLITNEQPELLEYFEVGKDVEVYHSKEELLEKTLFYLNHEELRTKIAQNGKDKAKQLFSFEEQLSKIFNAAHLL